METEEEIRMVFWDSHPQYDEEYHPSKSQNDYKCDIRCAFVVFVDNLNKNGTITAELASDVTL